jgi:hypothetical protein
MNTTGEKTIRYLMLSVINFEFCECKGTKKIELTDKKQEKKYKGNIKKQPAYLVLIY